MKVELIVIGCFILLIYSSHPQIQPWAANMTPMRQRSITYLQQSKGNATQIQQKRPKIQSKQTKPALSTLQANIIKQSYNQPQFQPQTNQLQAKWTPNLGISQNQTSMNFTKLNPNRIKQNPTRQAANLSQQVRRTQNKAQANLNRQRAPKPISQFKINQSSTNPIQQLRNQPNKSQRQRNLGLSQQKQAQTQRNRSPKKQMINNLSQVQIRNKTQTRQTPKNIPLQIKQKLPQQIQPHPIQNLQKASQTNNQSRKHTKPQLNQILHENSTYPPEPHLFKMTPIYNPIAQRSPKFILIKKLFDIGAAYFRKVLKVTPIPQRETYYKDMLNQNRCQNIFDAKYRQEGFNQNITDIVIYVNLAGKVSSNHKGLACCITLRPTYGVLSYLDPDLVLDYFLRVQSLLKYTIQSMLQILAFNQNNYKLFRMNYASSQIRPSNQTIKCDDLNCYIITPKVKKYVREYFNCNNSEIGAMLQSKNSLSNLNFRVYKDDIMVPFALTITVLDLSLLEDSGFFYSVNYTYTQKTNFGRGKGCSFAQGMLSNQNYCQPNVCDDDNRNGQNCIKLNSSTDLTFAFTPTSYYCDNYVLQIEDPFTFSYFGQSSRCFNIQMDGNRAPVCYKAECKNGVAYVDIGNKSFTRNNSGQWLEVDYYWKVQCPKDLQSFCAVSTCNNFCEGNGMCINGKCIVS